MKANRIILLALAAAALLSSCTKRYYTVEEGTQMSHFDFSIKSNDWLLEDAEGGGYLLSVKLDVPAITREVVDYGTITVARRLSDGKGNIYWTPLPCVRAESIDYGTSDEYLYSTYLDYEWTVGSVYVYFTATDLYVEPDKADWPSMDLRVTVML